jgi:hypothetical protein
MVEAALSTVRSTSWPRASIVFSAAVASVLLAYCHGMGRRSWSEEVRLDDGRTLEIDRYVKFDSSNSLAGDSFSSKDLKSTLVFKGNNAISPEWDIPLVPIVLYADVTASEWVIVATTSNCDTWAERGSPRPPYWEYRLKGERWTQVPVSKTSYGRKTNLFFDYEGGVPRQQLTAAFKDYILSNRNFGKKWRSVDETYETNCG